MLGLCSDRTRTEAARGYDGDRRLPSAADGRAALDDGAKVLAAWRKANPVICAWCPDFDPLDPMNKYASHGMCQACAEKW